MLVYGELLLADRRIGGLQNCLIRLERCTECAADGGERCHEPGERGIVGKLASWPIACKHVRSDDEFRSSENQRKQGDIQETMPIATLAVVAKLKSTTWSRTLDRARSQDRARQ